MIAPGSKRSEMYGAGLMSADPTVYVLKFQSTNGLRSRARVG